VENDPPDILDMKMAVRSMRNNKSSGKDNIRIKPYKKGRRLLINMLRTLIKRMWIEERVHTEWKTNIIVPMYKNKGEELQCHECRETS